MTCNWCACTASITFNLAHTRGAYCSDCYILLSGDRATNPDGWKMCLPATPPAPKSGCPKCGDAGKFIRMSLCCPKHGSFGGI